MARNPTSIRLSSADEAFLKELDIGGAESVSAKIMALIARARQERESRSDYGAALRYASELVDEASDSVARGQNALGLHSEPVRRIHSWAPDFLARLLVGMEDEPTAEQLVQLEDQLVKKVFTLMEAMLQLGVTEECNCYDPSCVRRHSRGVLNLAAVIKENTQS